MLFGSVLLLLSSAAAHVPVKNFGLASSKYTSLDIEHDVTNDEDAKSPRVVVVGFNEAENEYVVEKSPIDLSYPVLVPGLSPLYPYVYCDKSYSICNVVAGENEINAAASLTALLTSPKFNFSETYFIVAGTGDIDPSVGPLGSVVLSKYTVSVDLQNEISEIEIPTNWTTGLYSYGANKTNELPKSWVGTEVFEVNDALRQRFFQVLSNVTLETTASVNATNQLFNLTGNTTVLNTTSFNTSSVRGGSRRRTVRSRFNSTSNGTLDLNETIFSISNITGPTYLTNVSAALNHTNFILGDSATSNVVFSGNILTNAISNITNVFTNGTGNFVITSKEDSAVLEAAVRGAAFGLTDYSRWALIRGGARYTRAPVTLANQSVAFANSNRTDATALASDNVYTAVVSIIKDIVYNWDEVYLNGTSAENYLGDVYGSLGGKPDFGPGPKYNFTTGRY